MAMAQQTRSNKHMEDFFPEGDQRLCPVRIVQAYEQKTWKLRLVGSTDNHTMSLATIKSDIAAAPFTIIAKMATYGS